MWRGRDIRFRRSPLPWRFGRAFPRGGYCPIPRPPRARSAASCPNVPNGLRAFLSIDDAPDQRVADDVGDGEADDGDALDAFEPADRVGEPRLRWVGQVDLVRVAADHHPAAHA